MKVFKIKPILVEQVRLKINKKNRIIDNEQGSLCEVTWFNNGEYQIKSISPASANNHALGLEKRIPFNPYNNGIVDEYGWGDRH